MTMKRLIVYEATTTIPVGKDRVDGITVQEADELQRYIIQNKLKTGHFLWALHSLKIVNYVGYIQLSTVAIEILPKISAVDAAESSRQALLMLLQESGYLKVTYSTLASQQLTRGSLLEIFGRLFAEMLMKELRRGLCAGYIYQEENLSLLCGKLLVSRQISNQMRRLPKAFCGYDEFSVNQRLNQFLKRVTRLLLSKVRNLYTVDLLAGCLLRFEGVEDVDFQVAEAAQINVDRLSRRFEPAMLLAKLFYQNQVMTMTQGKTEAFSILFAMNDLFESYVGQLCARILPYRTKIQSGTNKLWVHKKTGRGAFSLRPDIIIEFENGEKIIIDTKWKWIRESAHRHGVSREDYFQMYAYLTRDTKVRAAVLLYPHHEGLGESGNILECYHLENQKEKELIISSITYEDKKKAVMDLESILVEAMGSVEGK